MDNAFDLMKIQNNMLMEQAKNEIRACNDMSERFGLTLSEADITELVQCRKSALKDSGRIEFSGGIIPKLIRSTLQICRK